MTGRKFSVAATQILIEGAEEFGRAYAECLNASISSDWNNDKLRVMKASPRGVHQGKSLKIDTAKLHSVSRDRFSEIGERVADKLKKLEIPD